MMTNRSDWKTDYDIGKTNDCPCCGNDSPQHSCRECHSVINKDICWKNDGYCQKCFDFIHNEIPMIHAQKMELGVKCRCDTAHCAKCLSVNCKDDNCPVHTQELKVDWHRRNGR